ncbi:MAG: DNA repair protein RecO [Chloroflexota bacterium]
MNRQEHNPRAARNQRSQIYRFTAVTLKHMELGETDRIVTVFTEEYGKHGLLARGIRRPGNRNAGAMEPFNVIRGTAVRGRTLNIMTQVETVKSFRELRHSEPLIATAGLFADLVDSLTLEEQPQKEIFDLLVASLDLLAEGESPARITLIFEYGLLRELGYRPELHTCLRCGAELEAVENGFDFQEGGVVCANCRRITGAEVVSVSALKLLRLLDDGAVRRVLSLSMSPEVILEVDSLLDGYIRSISGQESSARRVIRELGLEFDAKT